MSQPKRRVTDTLLDVLEVLVLARQDGSKVFGGEIVKRTRQSSPAVYQVLHRLADDEWVAREWEQDASAEAEGRPRRRLYELTNEGAAGALAILADRRPAASHTMDNTQVFGIHGFLIPGATSS